MVGRSGQKWSEDFYKEGILNGTVKSGMKMDTNNGRGYSVEWY